MDVNQKHLKSLINQTDSAFERYKRNPSSDEYAQAYEYAKSTLDQYMTDIRSSLQQKVKKTR